MQNLKKPLLGVAIALALFVAATPVRAESPKVTYEAQDGWFKTTHVVVLNRAAAIKLRDGLNRADPRLIGTALTRVCPERALKVILVIVTHNADAFKRELNKEGAIGQNGVTITLTTYLGRGRLDYDVDDWKSMIIDALSPDPDRLGIKRRALILAEMMINPWSWEMEPRD